MRLRRRHALLTGLIAAALLTANPAPAQTAAEFTPQLGQDGKDVIWIPTPKRLVEKMLKMAEVKPSDLVFDLGSGDGITVITAAKQFGSRATGIEFNQDMVELSKRNAQREGVADRTEFIRGDIFTTDFSKATVLTMYLLPTLNLELRPTILNMKPGTRVVSHAFTMSDWSPDQTTSVESRTAYLWIVPAKVEGRWQLANGALDLQQKFQSIEGVFITADNASTHRITHTNLRGDQISFTINGATYSGRVTGPTMQGSMKTLPNGQSTSWSAVLVRPQN